MGLKANIDPRRLALDQGVHEKDPELLFRVGKEEQQKFCETIFPKDQEERDPVWQEAI